MTGNPHIGSSFEDFLQEEGTVEEVNAAAVKHVLAWQIAEAMKEQGISKNQMAKRMHCLLRRGANGPQAGLGRHPYCFANPDEPSST